MLIRKTCAKWGTGAERGIGDEWGKGKRVLKRIWVLRGTSSLRITDDNYNCGKRC